MVELVLLALQLSLWILTVFWLIILILVIPFSVVVLTSCLLISVILTLIILCSVSEIFLSSTILQIRDQSLEVKIEQS